jgi:hypothetical protein
MELIPYLVAELDRETQKSRHALEQVPADKRGWKPHDRSMEFGYLADMVATIPSWITMILNQDELDIAPKDGKTPTSDPLTTSDAYIMALDGAARPRARHWPHHGSAPAHPLKLLAGGKIVSDTTRLNFYRTPSITGYPAAR